MIHITTNSLFRIAEQEGCSGPGYRRCACGAQPSFLSLNSDPTGNHVIISDLGVGFETDGVRHVTCPVCRVLVDGALERKDVRALMKLVVP